ncbi:hypothetical protein ABIB99_005878 [Bradyrhizobium sp. LA6.1]|uniref:hypothetical protein n=1 Tax=Bradyrhizobium sp. LA6.1 TaxID=3156378 RepID=UPI00339A1F4A
MTDLDDDTERSRKERSPSFPFISLSKAVDRARTFYDAHRRNSARLATIAETWGYAPASSGLQQTVAALKSYGLLEDVGRGQDRRIQLSDLAHRILHDTRPGAKESSIREASLRPRLFAEYAEKWLPNRPSDNHCLSELHLDRGFTQAAAQMFLRGFDETVTFANLKNEDSLSSSLEEGEMVSHGNPEGDSPPMTGLSATGAGRYSSRPQRFAGGGLPVEPLVPRATLPLPEGTVALEIPRGISGKSHAALKSWLELMVALAEPTPEEPESKP